MASTVPGKADRLGMWLQCWGTLAILAVAFLVIAAGVVVFWNHPDFLVAGR